MWETLMLPTTPYRKLHFYFSFFSFLIYLFKKNKKLFCMCCYSFPSLSIIFCCCCFISQSPLVTVAILLLTFFLFFIWALLLYLLNYIIALTPTQYTHKRVKEGVKENIIEFYFKDNDGNVMTHNKLSINKCDEWKGAG